MSREPARGLGRIPEALQASEGDRSADDDREKTAAVGGPLPNVTIYAARAATHFPSQLVRHDGLGQELAVFLTLIEDRLRSLKTTLSDKES